MDELQTTHPGPEQLQAYRLGHLDPLDLAEIERHLAACDSCQQALSGLPRTSAGPGRSTSDEAVATSALPPPESSGAEGTAAYSPSDDAFPTDQVGERPTVYGVPEGLARHPRYHILELLGTGGMGTVYKAEHHLMRRLVALKVIHPHLVGRPAMVERFRREVQAAARLGHPNIVTAHDADQAGTTHFLVMEFVNGRSLADVVAEQGPLPVARACDYARQVALGLEHAHESGMVHRDVKPHNLMLTPDGRVKILDFGLARFARESGPLGESAGISLAGEAAAQPGPQQAGAVTEAGSTIGTADYIAPEQARDAHTADIRADIYSLGCTLYHFLAGHPPFPGGTLVDKLTAHAQRTPRPLAGLRRDLPPGLVRVVERMMAKDPAQRYQTPGEVAEALAPFAAVRAREGRWRRTLRAGLVLVLLTLLGLWGCWTGPEVYRFVTDQGRLVIETDGQDVTVLVQQGRETVRVFDTRTERAINLHAGSYRLELAEDRGRLELSESSFTLQRGGSQTVRVQLRHGGPDREPPFRSNGGHPPDQGPGPPEDRPPGPPGVGPPQGPRAGPHEDRPFRPNPGPPHDQQPGPAGKERPVPPNSPGRTGAGPGSFFRSQG